MITSKHVQSAFKQLGLLILAILIFAIFINLSWFDEELHPQLQVLKVPQLIELEDNAYPLVWGLQAASDKEPTAVGAAIIKRQRELYEQGEKIEISPKEFERIFGGNHINKSWQDQFPSLACNSRLALDCVDKLMAEIQANENSLSDQQLQTTLQRYEVIMERPSFQENQEGDAFTNLPSYGILMNASRIYLVSKSMALAPHDFITLLDKDYQFWLRMLKGGEYLIAKMVALAGIRNNLQTASYLIRNNYFPENSLIGLQSVYRNLSEEERNIAETFEAEMRIILLSWRSQAFMFGEPSWLQKLFWQENATLNDTYFKEYMPVQVLAGYQPHEFYQRNGMVKQANRVNIFPSDLYNIGGKLAVKKSIGNFSIHDYVTRVNDTVGQINSLKLQIELASNAEKPKQEVVRQSNYRNPFTQQAMDYDSSLNTVGFECLSPGQKDICKVRL